MKLTINFSFSVELAGSKPALLTRTSWRRRAKRVKQRDGAVCYYCRQFSPEGQVDHIIPLTRGGTDDLENLVWTCMDCNNSKGDKTPDEWKASKDFTEAQDSITIARILDLHAQGESGSEIERQVFGHTGGSAYHKVKAVLSENEENQDAQK